MKLNADIAAVYADREFLEKNILSRGFDSGIGSPEKFAEFIRTDMANKETMIKNARIPLQ